MFGSEFPTNSLNPLSIRLAILSFAAPYSVLGLVPSLIPTVVVAAIVFYTSLVLWSVKSSVKCNVNLKTNITLGSFVYDILKWGTFATLDKCLSRARNGRGMRLSSCSSWTIPSFRHHTPPNLHTQMLNICQGLHVLVSAKYPNTITNHSPLSAL